MVVVAAVICGADAVAAVDDVEPAPPTGMPFSSLQNYRRVNNMNLILCVVNDVNR